MLLFVKELIEVNSVEDANLYLKKGWKLIIAEPGSYVLGKPRELEKKAAAPEVRAQEQPKETSLDPGATIRRR